MHSDIRPFPATQHTPLPSQTPQSAARTATATCDAGCSAAIRTAGSMKEPCATCGTTLWVEAVFTNNTLVCADCAREIRRVQESRPMPPTRSQQRSLLDWIAPHREALPKVLP